MPSIADVYVSVLPETSKLVTVSAGRSVKPTRWRVTGRVGRRAAQRKLLLGRAAGRRPSWM